MNYKANHGDKRTKLIDITCPKCGAALKPKLNKEAVLCEYCGTTLGIEKENSLRKRIPNKVKVPLLVIGVLIFIGSLAWTVTELSKPVINPFDCIAVSFEGADGKGSVVLKPTHAVEGVDINHIDFHISKDNFLSEDDSISIDASSKYYRLEEKTKVYIVRGLNKYLTDLDNISEESLEMIDRKMRTSLEGNLAGALIFDDPLMRENTMVDFVRRVENSFKDKNYLKLISTSRQRWFDEEIEVITKGIVDFLKNL